MPKKGISDRSDPRKNKSLAIRIMLRKMPTAKAAAVADAVTKEFGHKVKPNMIYMVKTKVNMAADGRPRRAKTNGRKDAGVPTSAAQWVEAIKFARLLLRATGSVANATALLKAVEG